MIPSLEDHCEDNEGQSLLHVGTIYSSRIPVSIVSPDHPQAVTLAGPRVAPRYANGLS